MSQPSPESSVRIEQLLERAAARAPEKAALIYGERVWTYGALRAEVDRRALALISAGLRPGTVIATTERVTDEVVIAFLAACRADITFLHLSPTFAVSEIATLARRGGATCILTAHGEPHTALPDLAILPVNVPDTSPVSEVGGLARVFRHHRRIAGNIRHHVRHRQTRTPIASHAYVALCNAYVVGDS